jgi:hypothetical protein
MTYTVSRKLTGANLDMDGRLRWFNFSAKQPSGTTKVSAPKKGPIVGVTPYVGERKGSCRYVHAATLTTKGSYGKGTASYSD